MKNILVVALIWTMIGSAFAQVRTENRQFFSESLNQMRSVVVHTCSTCTAESPCPVVVFLSGWLDLPTQYNFFNTEMAKLLTNGQIRPLIVVVPDGNGGLYSATGYWDSPVNGLHGTYIVKDLVEWISQQYPVVKDLGGQHRRASWLIAGYSMGGGGGARLALTNPELFCGFASFSGGLDFDYFRDWFHQANIENPTFHYGPPNINSLYTYGVWQYASIFSPDTSAQFMCQFPLVEGTGLIRDSVFARWLQESAVTLAREYYVDEGHPASAMRIYVRNGLNDDIVGGYRASKGFIDTLLAWGIDHNYREHTYGHDFNSDLADEFLVWTDSIFRGPTSSAVVEQPVPESFELKQNYPNPFNPSTTIRYVLPQRSRVNLSVYNTLGQLVSTLVNGEEQAGQHEVKFDGSNLASGVYFYRLQAGSFVQTKKLLLVW